MIQFSIWEEFERVLKLTADSYATDKSEIKGCFGTLLKLHFVWHYKY